GASGMTGDASWAHALRVGLAGRLEELVDGWRACAQLRHDIGEGLAGAPVPLRRTAAFSSRELHRDYGMALLSALAALLAIGLCCAFWILTGWPSGSVAAMMAAVFCSFFAAMDDPVPAIHGFLKYTLWSVPISTVYVLLLLPGVQDFGMLVLICAPTFLVLGCYAARPASVMTAMPLLFGVAGALALYDTASADLVSFINTMIAQALGVVVAARVTRLVRSVGAEWSAQRIQRATWRELGEMAAAPRQQNDDDAYAVRMLDRIGLLAPRIAQAGGTIEGVTANDALHDLRVGADIATLQRTRSHLPAAAIAAVTVVLEGIADFFRSRAAGRTEPRPGTLLVRIDAALAGALSAPDASPLPSPEWRAAVTALVGLRRNLFAEAPTVLPVVQGAT
ncbi:MAG TPA: FUSC family protein, partial [Burkholderiaceae bacterium]